MTGKLVSDINLVNPVSLATVFVSLAITTVLILAIAVAVSDKGIKGLIAGSKLVSASVWLRPVQRGLVLIPTNSISRVWFIK